MRYQAFIDESYQPNGEFIFAGYIAKSEAWEELSEKWEDLCREIGLIDECGRPKEFRFKKIVRSNKSKYIPLFFGLIEDHVHMALSCRINIQEYRLAQSRISVAGPQVNFGPLHNPYRIAFKTLMDRFHNSPEAFEPVLAVEDTVDFIFDEETGASRTIQEAWDEYLATRPLSGRSYGRKPQWLNSSTSKPLQAADLWAGLLRRAYARGEGREFLCNGDDLISYAKHSPPRAAIELNENDLTEALLGIARELTDQPLYDVRWQCTDL
ncbi:MAG: DUF3800 domain-containing protein [Roseicyclus sp.]